jgi:hypothetical protein
VLPISVVITLIQGVVPHASSVVGVENEGGGGRGRRGTGRRAADRHVQLLVLRWNAIPAPIMELGCASLHSQGMVGKWMPPAPKRRRVRVIRRDRPVS